MIDLFDSLTHPTLSGDWLGRGIDSSFDTLSRQLSQAGFSGACAVGLHNVEQYAHEAFIAQCSRFPELIPIAGFDPAINDVDAEMQILAKLGFKGIKVHPRFSKISLCQFDLGRVLASAATANLTTFVCTYYQSTAANWPSSDPLEIIAQAVAQAPDAKLVLVHGGGVELLRYAEFTRHNQNVLLDLSLTLTKYATSSVDADIRFLFAQFDRRICIGSDHPEWSHQEIRLRFDEFSSGLPRDKKANVAFRNIKEFLA